MAPALVKEIDESYQDGVVESFLQKVHNAKPVFSFVGLTGLTGKAEELERKCKEVFGVFEVSDLYNELKNQYSHGFPIIEKEVKRLKANPANRLGNKPNPMKLDCIIVDDEPLARSFLERFCNKQGVIEVMGSFPDSEQALSFLSENEIDIIFLDVEMRARPVLSYWINFNICPG